MTGPTSLVESTEPIPRVGSDTGLLYWISTADHKLIGIMYLLAALFFFGLGGFQALLIRVQLAQPGNRLLLPDTYNQVFTMHGTTMIFLVVVPVLIVLGFILCH
jgi:cytochrome c oxidase subunit 1